MSLIATIGATSIAGVQTHNTVIYSAHQKSGDNLSFSYFLPLQHHVLSTRLEQSVKTGSGTVDIVALLPTVFSLLLVTK